MSNPSVNNFMAVYPLLIERLKGIDGISHVLEASQLAELLNQGGARLTVPMDDAVYVVFDGMKPVETRATQARVQLSFTLYLAKAYYKTGNLNLTQAGEMMTNILLTVLGWDARVDNDFYLTKPFTAVNPPSVIYNDGFALYPVSFQCECSIG